LKIHLHVRILMEIIVLLDESQRHIDAVIEGVTARADACQRRDRLNIGPAQRFLPMIARHHDETSGITDSSTVECWIKSRLTSLSCGYLSSLAPHSLHTFSSVVINTPKMESGTQTKATTSKGQKHSPATHIPKLIARTAARTIHPTGETFFFIKGGNVLPQ
jgi:hypothetical protein